MPSRRSPPPLARRSGARPPPRAAGSAPRREPAAAPLGPREIDELQRLLDAVPGPLEPLDVVMLDGFLCGVLLQPEAVPAARWEPQVTDVDGRPLPGRFDAARLLALVRRRHAELDRAIAGRRWFDPWVFELEAAPGEEPADAAADDGSADEDNDENADASDDLNDAAGEAEAAAASEAVYPWVAGFAAALETFPALLQTADDALTEPLALLYRHLDPEDLEDADALLEAMEELGPPADLADAVEGLVRAVLLLADVTRPLGAAPR